jgi:PAS domain S-box-containing protein
VYRPRQWGNGASRGEEALVRVLVDGVVTKKSTFADVAQALSLGLPYQLRLNADLSDPKVLHVGDGCQAMLGVPAEAALADGGVFYQLVPPEDREGLRAKLFALIAEGRPWEMETRVRIRGEARWLKVSAAPSVLEDGGTEWDGLVVDITESKQLAEQLAEERRRLALTVELTGIGLFEWDRSDQSAVHLSDNQYDILGLPRGSPVTLKDFRELIHPDDRDLAAEARRWTYGVADQSDRVLEYRIVRPNGEHRWLLSHMRVRRDEEGLRALQGATVDITERRNAEELRRLQLHELSHRAKNALAVLMAMVQQATRTARTPEDLAEVIMGRLVAMSRSQDLATALEGAPLALPALLRQALDAFDLSRFEVDASLTGVTVPGGPVVALALLMHELATNAVKYGALSTEGGRVRLARVAAPAGRLALEWRELGGPSVRRPEREGFGMRLVAAALRGVGGYVEPTFPPEGFVARMEMPAS